VHSREIGQLWDRPSADGRCYSVVQRRWCSSRPQWLSLPKDAKIA
jgi:hypothetical protein